MRIGNLAEPVLKRSVLRQLNMGMIGARGHYGADCVPLAESEYTGNRAAENGCAGTDSRNTENGFAEQKMRCACVGAVPASEYHPELQIIEAVNRLAAGGAAAQSLLLHAVLPEVYEETELQRDMKKLAAAAKAYGLVFADVQIQVSQGVLLPQYFLTAAGIAVQSEDTAHGQLRTAASDRTGNEHTATGTTEKAWRSSGLEQWEQLLQPGQELVMTKWIALAGTAYLAELYEAELLQRYPFSLIDRAKEFDKLISADREARAITHFGACAMHHLSQGGIFNGLWEMADRAGVGLEVDLKKIPVKQETIEICEYFDINPYYLYSAGALLIGTDRAETLIAQLEAQNIPAVVIGRVTDSRDRVIRNGEDCRFLDRPKQDEWYRRIRHA